VLNCFLLLGCKLFIGVAVGLHGFGPLGVAEQVDIKFFGIVQPVFEPGDVEFTKLKHDFNLPVCHFCGLKTDFNLLVYHFCMVETHF
jgi:hypothetical protein